MYIMKTRAVTVILALLLGITGFHRFYLGDNYSGSAFFTGLMVCIVLSLFGMGSWSFAMLGMIAVADAINFSSMSHQAFDEQYNGLAHIREGGEL
jgi:TM2 domain-containing membrane protein YozV